MGGRIRWIDAQDGLRAAAIEIGAGPLALDSEADSLHHYPEKVCLVQLSAHGVDSVIDPLTQPDLSALAEPLADPRVRTILHGADYDLRVLNRDHGLVVRGLFDTMVAARLVGERTFGLANLLESRFGVKLDKRFQRADWSRRPLPPAMLEYAAMDTRWLEPLAGTLESRLYELGRSEWARQEFARLEAIRWRDHDDVDAFRRVKGASALDGRGLAALRELYAARERLARRRDRPPFMVLANDALIALARERPEGLDAVAQALPRSRGRREDEVRSFSDALCAAAQIPETQLPPVERRRRPPQNPQRERRFLRLRDRRNTLAKELDLEPSLLAPRSTLEAIVVRHEEGEDPFGVDELRPWQRELLEPLAGSLDG